MAFPSQFLDELKSRTSLVEVISRKVKLTRKGREHTGLCPFHNEKTPSFTVNETKGFYHCFGCGAHGDAVSFEMKANGLSFLEAVEKLAHRAGMEMPKPSKEEAQKQKKRFSLYEITTQATKFFQKSLKMPEGREALAYLKDRGLSDETIEFFKLGFAPFGNALKAHLTSQGFEEKDIKACGLINIPNDGRSSYDYFRNRIMFPISNPKGKIVGFGGRVLDDSQPKYLNSPETVLFDKRRTLYSFYESREEIYTNKQAIVCEGYMDVIALYQAGIKNAVASLGTAFSQEHINLLWRVDNEPIMCFDGDNAGKRAAFRASEIVLPILKPSYSLRFLLLPDGKDPDDYVKINGTSAFRDLLKKPLNLSDIIWQRLSMGSFDTPEKKAGLEKKIEEITNEIKDNTIKNHYKRDLKSRFWDKFSNFSGNKKYKNKANFFTIPSSIASEQAEAKMLIAYMISYPELAIKWIEEIISFSFENENLENIIATTSELIIENPDITKQEILDELSQKQKEFLSQELSIIKNREKRTISISTEEEEFMARIYNLRQKILTLEIDTLAQEISKEDNHNQKDLWNRYKALVEERQKLLDFQANI
jgi:DNA primase